VSRRKCDAKSAVILLYKHGVSIDVIAEALCLKKSTVRQYIYLYLKRRQEGIGVTVQQQPEPQRQQERQLPVAENQWIALLRSRGQQQL